MPKTHTSPRTVLVTGASAGIGRATVQYFVESGWRVIGLDRHPHDGDFPSDGVFIQADLADPKAVQSAFSQIKDFAPSLDALVNNAAVQLAKPLLQTTLDEWDDLMNVNLRGVFLAIQHAHPLLKSAGGAVVNIASVHALATSAGIAAYAASKGGLLALTRALAIEFAPDGIRVNAVLPGAVDTPMLHAGLDRGHAAGDTLAARLAAIAKNTVIGRVGTPAEIAHAIYFLADNTQSSFMTGQSLVVDGGATARLSTE
ncbi:MAG: SDR family oxidoreductase [Anaerolineae bacterium]|nr:SDR family oxidoreductase [Anaerolineae bacterium]